jgi:hypothetical protein
MRKSKQAIFEKLTEDTEPPNVVEEVKQTELPPSVKKLSDEYDREIGHRREFLWSWVHTVYDHFTLDSVPDERMEATKTRKTLMTMFISIVDDIAEVNNDRETFEQARKIPFPDATINRTKNMDLTALSMAEDVWDELVNQLSNAPRYDEFLSQFRYDIRQGLNSVDYSLLVTESPDIATQTGALHYISHNMVFFSFMNIDLMASPEFAREDLATVRELFWRAQDMGRICNWIATWEREVHEGDYSSGVIIRAIQEGVIEPGDIENRPKAVIETIQGSNIEEKFIGEWYELYNQVDEFDGTTQSPMFEKPTELFETIMIYHLTSEGHI